jgi:hypothetical protein
MTLYGTGMRRTEASMLKARYRKSHLLCEQDGYKKQRKLYR